MVSHQWMRPYLSVISGLCELYEKAQQRKKLPLEKIIGMYHNQYVMIRIRRNRCADIYL